MKSKKEIVGEYLDHLYGEERDNEMYMPEIIQSMLDFSKGYDSGQRQIKNKLNHLKSDLAQEKIIKPSKTINIYKIEQLEQMINLLEYLI